MPFTTAMENQDFDFIHVARLIHEVTSEAMCIISPEQQIQFCNQAMVKVFAFDTTDDLLHLSYDTLFADPQQFIFLSNKINQEGVLTRERALFVRKEGSVFWGHLTSRKLMHNGQYYDYVTLRDISEQIKKEEFTRDNTLALEKVNAELNRFIYSASHDLRAPISSIMGLVHLMKIDRDPSKLDHLIGLMEASLDRLDNFIRNLTYFNRNKTTNTRRTKIDFLRIISQIRERMMRHTHFDRIEFRTHFQLAVPFYSNRFRIELILEEIIRNAYDFHDVSKSSPFISIDIQGDSEQVSITIEDNGAGIPGIYLSSVFDMFFRASPRSQGSGIGLFVAQEAVSRLLGKITLNSELGMGTQVMLTLPIIKSPGIRLDKKRKTKK